MSTDCCPHCGGSLALTDNERCIWCGSPVTAQPAECRPGDVIRISNRFKGGHVEEVTVVRLERGGHGIEIMDNRGQVWGCIWPTEILAVLNRR